MDKFFLAFVILRLFFLLYCFLWRCLSLCQVMADLMPLWKWPAVVFLRENILKVAPFCSESQELNPET